MSKNNVKQAAWFKSIKRYRADGVMRVKGNIARVIRVVVRKSEFSVVNVLPCKNTPEFVWMLYTKSMKIFMAGDISKLCQLRKGSTCKFSELC